MLNKRGYTDISDSVMFIVAFSIIGLVIGVSINLFYAHEIDLREQELDILVNKIVTGMSRDGLNDVENLDIYKVASLDRNVINNGYYYFRIEIHENGIRVRNTILEGNREFDVNCQLPGDKLPKCKDESFSVGKYDVYMAVGANYFGSRL